MTNPPMEIYLPDALDHIPADSWLLVAQGPTIPIVNLPTITDRVLLGMCLEEILRDDNPWAYEKQHAKSMALTVAENKPYSTHPIILVISGYNNTCLNRPESSYFPFHALKKYKERIALVIGFISNQGDFTENRISRSSNTSTERIVCSKTITDASSYFSRSSGFGEDASQDAFKTRLYVIAFFDAMVFSIRSSQNNMTSGAIIRPPSINDEGHWLKSRFDAYSPLDTTINDRLIAFLVKDWSVEPVLSDFSDLASQAIQQLAFFESPDNLIDLSVAACFGNQMAYSAMRTIVINWFFGSGHNASPKSRSDYDRIRAVVELLTKNT